MKIILTGISGFLGAELARRLVADGHLVCAFVRPNSSLNHISDLQTKIEFKVLDGTTLQLVELIKWFKPDQVMHLASNFIAEHTADDVDDLIRSNIKFPTQLLEAMVAADCRNFINTGTSWQHFGVESYRPVNLYAATKQAFEDLLAYYSDAHAMSNITLKLYDTYGPNDRRRKLIHLLMNAARTGEQLEMSPGEQIIDLLHSEDVVTAFIMASARLSMSEVPLRESFLISGERVTIRELVAKLEKIGGWRIPVAWATRPYRIREVMQPVEALNCALPGWSPVIPLEKGLTELIYKNDK